LTKLYSALISSILLLAADYAQGAACCGGGFAAPSLIVGDDRAQLTASYAYSQVVSDVGSDLLWRRRSSKETTETWKLDAAHIFSDQWQAGLSAPLIKRSRAANATTGLGDISATLGYEFLPDWDFNPWRPKGIAFLQLTAPTGRSIAESETAFQLDSRGRGFWAAGLGTMLTKTLGNWDFFASIDTHRSFAKNFSNSQAQGRLEPGWGGNAGGGVGFNFSSFRMGGSLLWTYEDPVRVTGTSESAGSVQRFATALLSASYLFDRFWALTLNYSDQTKFGKPVNTSLGRGVALLVQRRWER